MDTRLDLQPALLRGGPPLGWGIVGTGEIATCFAAALRRHTDQPLVAVASRSPERADAFAREFAIGAAGSYASMLSRDDVDAVYIAAPNAEHARLAQDAIAAGKHVLVEKPLTTSVALTRDLIEAARAKGILLMEAMWTRFLPHTLALQQVLRSGELGDICLVTVNLGWQSDFSPGNVLFDPFRGGGIMLDAGIYALWLARFVAGDVAQVRAVGTLAPTGADIQAAVALDHAGGAQSSLAISCRVDTPGIATIEGVRGRIEFRENFVFPAEFSVTVGEESTTRGRGELEGRDGLAWEAVAFAHYASMGLSEAPLHTHADSLELLRLIELVQCQLGVPTHSDSQH